jgi:hypothetical protein
MILARNEQRADRLTRAAEEKHCREAHQRPAIYMEECCRPQPARKAFPAQSANRVARVDDKNGEKQQREPRLAHGFGKELPAEAFVGDRAAQRLEQRPDQDDRQRHEEAVAERAAHRSRTVAATLAQCQADAEMGRGSAPVERSQVGGGGANSRIHRLGSASQIRAAIGSLLRRAISLEFTVRWRIRCAPVPRNFSARFYVTRGEAER